MVALHILTCCQNLELDIRGTYRIMNIGISKVVQRRWHLLARTDASHAFDYPMVNLGAILALQLLPFYLGFYQTDACDTWVLHPLLEIALHQLVAQ